MTVYYLKDGNGSMIEATAELLLDKENFESYLDESLNTVISGEEWETITEEIDERLNGFLDELLPILAKEYLAGLIGGKQGAKNAD